MIPLVTPTLKSSDEVDIYTQELTHQLQEIGISDPYYGWYLCSTYGKKASKIINKMNKIQLIINNKFKIYNIKVKKIQ